MIAQEQISKIFLVIFVWFSLKVDLQIVAYCKSDVKLLLTKGCHKMQKHYKDYANGCAGYATVCAILRTRLRKIHLSAH
ncbi:hypothetical protein A0256_03250 [Mucilaginibacter sp. PAMC 26640]|nr:hypothetical protein A0256_03250 [Mucilaginibacter sp. PAMC 26640]